MVTRDDILEHYRHYTDPIPDGLLAAIRENRCLALVGSGVTSRCLSKSRAPLPGWAGLLRELVQWGNKEGVLNGSDAGDLMELIESADFLLVAQELREQMGDGVLSRFIAQTFDPDRIVPSLVHDLLSVVPFRGYITTNYDNLLERAYMSVKKRQLERVVRDGQTSLKNLEEYDPFLLKLHGDLEIPSSIVLGYRDYLGLISDARFQTLLDAIFSKFSLLMVGYGLTDLDIVQSLDRTAHAGTCRRHYLLSRRGTRNSVERRRLLGDRNIETIEYVDYFGFHNHVDTFLEGVMAALDRSTELNRIRPRLRTTIHVHYPTHCTSDGQFVWNYLFREGAVTLSSDAQAKQIDALKGALDRGFTALRYLAFVVDKEGFADTTFLPLIESTIEKSKVAGTRVIFLVVGSSVAPDEFVPAAAGCPVFYLKEKFGEMDLETLRGYIAQQMKARVQQLYK